MIRNAPYYHVVFDDCEFVSMQDAEIYVDVWGQLSLHQLFGTDFEPIDYGQYTLEVPIFPLNTDGIDIWAQNVHISRVKVTNFDDAIVPKPSNQWNKIAKCSSNITIEDSLVTYSIGLAVGSVPPSEGHACI